MYMNEYIYSLPSIHKPLADFLLFNLTLYFRDPDRRGMGLVQQSLSTTFPVPPQVAHTRTNRNNRTYTGQCDLGGESN